MKIQLLAAVTVLALSATTAQASRSSGTDITNDSKNALAIGETTGAVHGAAIKYSGGRAIAGSVVLEGDACACEFNKLNNTSKNAVAVGAATAGSIHIATMGAKK